AQEISRYLSDPRTHSNKHLRFFWRNLMAATTNLFRVLFLTFLCTLPFAASTILVFVQAIHGDEKPVSDPWPAGQIVRPADLARELSDKTGALPTVAYVGFRTLFAGGHIPGATFHGSGSTEQGLSELKKWADALPRTTNLVIYCGCCPFEKCPNIRPAFIALN